MEPIMIISTILVTIILLKTIFKIDLKKIEPLKENKELEELTEKFPKNIEIAKEMLTILGNNKVKIKEAKNTQTSLYIVVTNKIVIANMENNYARIQTIAHECLHSIQDRRLLLFNFIFSNIIILYWLLITVLNFINIMQYTFSSIFMLLLFAIIKLAVRGFLEIDAMIKSRYLAEKYIKLKNVITDKETEKLLNQYDEINKLGIPFIIVQILISSLFGILIYALISIL